MAVISQKDRPIGLTVVDQGIFSGNFSLSLGSIPSFHLFSPRPEELSYGHPGRGTAIQTLDGGFIDDFGEGLTDITIRGHTGWNQTIPGELQFYALRDLVTLRYHDLRAQKAEASQPINDVKMYLVDTLNAFMYEVYPLQFRGTRSRQQPLLYKYEMRLVGVNRTIGLSDLIGGIGL